jgi:CRISPR-associated protein Cas1
VATLYLDRQNLTLRLDGSRLVIEEPAQRPRGIPFTLLERVVLRGRVGLDSAVLGALAEQGIAVVCLSGRHSRRTALLFGSGHNDARRRLAQYQLQHCADLRLAWSRALVEGKLRAQARVLADVLAVRADCRKALTDGGEQLRRLLPALAGAADLNGLRGLEGAGAAAYFAALTQVFPPALGFTERNRRPPRDPVNACLSLGYTLLHAEAVIACHSAGLDPLLGFFHDPAYGRESLACDFIEPLRPRLDIWVWNLARQRALTTSHFVQDKGACLLNKEGRQVFYGSYELFARPPRRYLRQFSYRFAKQLVTLAPVWEEAANA